jgi:hypothetical protein
MSSATGHSEDSARTFRPSWNDHGQCVVLRTDQADDLLSNFTAAAWGFEDEVEVLAVEI